MDCKGYGFRLILDTVSICIDRIRVFLGIDDVSFCDGLAPQLISDACHSENQKLSMYSPTSDVEDLREIVADPISHAFEQQRIGNLPLLLLFFQKSMTDLIAAYAKPLYG